MTVKGLSLPLKNLSPESAKAMCYIKKPFDSKNAARDAGVKLGQTPYKCLVCTRWHLTSLTNKEGNKAKRKARLQSL